MKANKITEENLSNLKLGDVLAKYPKSGDPENDFDFTATENTSYYKIKSSSGYDTFHLAPIDSPSTILSDFGAVNIGKLNKKVVDLANEAIWWKIIDEK